MNLNKVFLIGNLTRDPELKSLPSGNSVVNFGLATNRMWKDKDGGRQQDTQFHNIVMFGKLAEIANQYLSKGSLAMIEGRIQTRQWQDRDGNKRYTTEIIAEGLQMGPKGSGGGTKAPQNQEQSSGGQNDSSDSKEELDTIEYPEEDDNINPDKIPF